MPIYGQMIINPGLRRRTPIIYALYTVKSAVKYTLDSLTLLRRLAELIIGLFLIKVTVRGTCLHFWSNVCGIVPSKYVSNGEHEVHFLYNIQLCAAVRDLISQIIFRLHG